MKLFFKLELFYDCVMADSVSGSRSVQFPTVVGLC